MQSISIPCICRGCLTQVFVQKPFAWPQTLHLQKNREKYGQKKWNRHWRQTGKENETNTIYPTVGLFLPSPAGGWPHCCNSSLASSLPWILGKVETRWAAHQRRFVSRHQPPENLRSHNWGATTQNTGGRAEQWRSVRSPVICSAFMLHLLSFCCEQETGTGWHFDALKIIESKLRITCDAVHVGFLWRACCVLFFFLIHI